jgi:hypothetical protein
MLFAEFYLIHYFSRLFYVSFIYKTAGMFFPNLSKAPCVIAGEKSLKNLAATHLNTRAAKRKKEKNHK